MKRTLLMALAPAVLACSGLLDTEELVARGQEVMAEGEAFGSETDQSGCVREGLRRQDGCGEMEVMCHAMSGVWLESCLGAAQPVRGFCDGVPPESEIMDSAAWRVARCDAEGHAGDNRCPNLMGAIQSHCHPD